MAGVKQHWVSRYLCVSICGFYYLVTSKKHHVIFMPDLQFRRADMDHVCQVTKYTQLKN